VLLFFALPNAVLRSPSFSTKSKFFLGYQSQFKPESLWVCKGLSVKVPQGNGKYKVEDKIMPACANLWKSAYLAGFVRKIARSLFLGLSRAVSAMFLVREAG
jgi:hypothetical protein